MFANYRAIFQHRPFALFWAGFTFSAVGDAVTRVALTWLVYERTGSPQALGWLALWYTGPVVAGGLLAGWLLDRFDRRRMMLLDNLVRGLAVAGVPLLAALGRLELWHIYAVAGVYGFLMMISLAGGPSLIPVLVPAEQLATANALETLSFVLGGIVGPVAAGVLIARVGAPNVVIIDAASYFAFALALARVRPRAEPASAADTAEGHSLGQAVQLLLREPVLLATTLMFMAANIGGGLLAVWLPIFADRNLHGGSELYGLLLGVSSAGEVVSAVLAGGVTLGPTLGVLICLGQALTGLALLLLLVGDTPTRVPVALLGLALYGFFSSPLTIWAQTLRMRVIPERLRGRTFALLRMLMQSGSPVGGALAGWLLPAVGLPAVIVVSGLVTGLPALAGLRTRALRED